MSNIIQIILLFLLTTPPSQQADLYSHKSQLLIAQAIRNLPDSPTIIRPLAAWLLMRVSEHPCVYPGIREDSIARLSGYLDAPGVVEFLREKIGSDSDCYRLNSAIALWEMEPSLSKETVRQVMQRAGGCAHEATLVFLWMSEKEPKSKR